MGYLQTRMASVYVVRARMLREEQLSNRAAFGSTKYPVRTTANEVWRLRAVTRSEVRAGKTTDRSAQHGLHSTVIQRTARDQRESIPSRHLGRGSQLSADHLHASGVVHWQLLAGHAPRRARLAREGTWTRRLGGVRDALWAS